MNLKEKTNKILRWSEKYTNTDMVYLVNSVFWVGLSKILVFFFSFLLMLAFSHLTSKETFGSYQYIISILGIVSVFSLPGVNTSLTKSVAQGKEGTLFYIVQQRLKWSIYGSIITLGVAFWYFIQENFALGISFLLITICLPFFLSYDSFEYFWNGKKNFKKGMSYSAISAIVPLGAMILTLLYSQNIIVIITVFILSNSLARFYYHKKTISQIKNKEIDKTTIRLGKSLSIIQGIDIISSYVDKIFIWKFLGPVPLAIYSFAQIPITKIIQLTPIQIISLPKLSEQNIAQEHSNIIKKFLKLFLIMIPVAILFFVFIPLLYKIFFPQYLEAISYVKALSILIVFMPFTFITTAMIANSDGKELVGIQTIIFILKIIFFFLLIPPYGIWGVIYTTITTELIKSSLIFYFFQRSKI